MPDVTVIDHPLVQHKLSLLRCRETRTRPFRRFMRELSLVVGCEVLRDLDLAERTIETPSLRSGEPVLLTACSNWCHRLSWDTSGWFAIRARFK